MRFLPIALLAAAFAGCEHKPSPEEAQQQREAELAAHGSPSPKPGAWMKDAKSPLDPKPK